MIFKQNIADEMQNNVMDLLQKFRHNIDPNLKATGFSAEQYETEARRAKMAKDSANSNMTTGFAFAGAGILSGAVGAAIIATTGIVGGAVLLGATSGIVIPALAFAGINKLIKNHQETIENESSLMVLNNSSVVRNKFSKDLNNALKSMNDKDYKEIVDQVSITDIKNSDIKSFDSKAEKFMSLVIEKSDKGGLFKKNVSDKLEEKVLKLMEKHKKDLDFEGNALNARNKADNADTFMKNSLLTASTGALFGVGGFAASLKLGVGTAAILGTGVTVSGALLAGGVAGIAIPALAFMGISKIIKSYHESVANKNETLNNYRRAEFDVSYSFTEKLSKILGKGSDIDSLAHTTGLSRDISKGILLDKNTEKLLDMIRENKPKVDFKTKSEIKNKI